MNDQVAPITGAWIETLTTSALVIIVIVAPITGAWIETVVVGRMGCWIGVAPITGAWIETSLTYFNYGHGHALTIENMKVIPNNIK